MDQGVQNSFTEVGPRVEKDLTYSSSNLDKNDFSQKCFCDSFNSTVLNIFIFHIAMYAPYWEFHVSCYILINCIMVSN